MKNSWLVRVLCVCFFAVQENKLVKLKFFGHATTVIQIKVECEIPDRMSIKCFAFYSVRPRFKNVLKLNIHLRIQRTHLNLEFLLVCSRISMLVLSTRSILNAYHSSLFSVFAPYLTRTSRFGTQTTSRIKWMESTGAVAPTQRRYRLGVLPFNLFQKLLFLVVCCRSAI